MQKYRELKKELATLRKYIADLETIGQTNYETILEAASKAGEAIIVIQDNSEIDSAVVYANQEATRMYGYTEEELRKVSWLDLIHPAYRDRAQDRIRRRLSGEVMFGINESVLITKKGEQIITEGVGSVLNFQGKPAIVSYFRDITQRKLMEAALRQSESNFRTLVETSPDGVFSLDTDGKVIDCNTALCGFLGCEKEEIKGKNLRDFARGVRQEILSLKPFRLDHKEYIEEEFEFFNSDGDLVPIWAKMVGYYDETSGNLLRVVAYVRDITQHKKLGETKDEFISLVSHELRTPLTVISGVLDTILNKGERLSTEATHKLLCDADVEANLLSHLLDNLLELTRLQADQLLLSFEPVSVDNTIQKVIDRVKRQYPSHKFVVEFLGEIPPILADELKLECILYNLIENAAKYSPLRTKVQISMMPDNENLAICVTDHGRGISVHQQKKLFVPFERLQRHRQDGIAGVGLGLVVCRRLVEAHGGRIWVNSKLGGGATFCFTVPLNTAV